MDQLNEDRKEWTSPVNPLVSAQLSCKSRQQGNRGKQKTEIKETIPATFGFSLILDLQPPGHVDLLALGSCSCHPQTSGILQTRPGPALPSQSVVVQHWWVFDCGEQHWQLPRTACNNLSFCITQLKDIKLPLSWHQKRLKTVPAPSPCPRSALWVL